MVELRKTGENQYEVLVDEQIIGQVWNWHGSWSAQAKGKTHHGYKSRKKAIERVEQIYRGRSQP
jgi:hypothetical protein